jgi:glutathione S-transferase
MMLTIYHMRMSRSSRIIWLAEELQLAYRLECFDWAPEHQLSHAYKALHPVARPPLLSDGSIMLAESGAIIDYLITRYGEGRLRPEASSSDYPEYLFWLHFAEGSMAQFVQVYRATNGGVSNPMGERATRRLKEDFDYSNEVLAQRSFFAGAELTGADINMVLALQFAQHATDWDLARYPHISAYLARIGERPAYRKAMELS